MRIAALITAVSCIVFLVLLFKNELARAKNKRADAERQDEENKAKRELYVKQRDAEWNQYITDNAIMSAKANAPFYYVPEPFMTDDIELWQREYLAMRELIEEGCLYPDEYGCEVEREVVGG